MTRVLAVPVVFAMLGGFVGDRADIAERADRKAPPQQSQVPTFKAGVDLVSVSVVVRDRDGRPVTGLSREDFELVDKGRPRSISDFRSEPAPISLAVLLDTSGSMRIDPKWQNARDAVVKLASGLDRGRDRIALYTFDTELHEVQPFTTTPAEVVGALKTVRPWGSTALFDAVEQTGRKLAEQGQWRRAVVVVTDGLDNRSHATAAGASAVVSAVDMPVYTIVVEAATDRVPDEIVAGDRSATRKAGTLENLSQWTGGALFTGSAPAEAEAAVRQILSELRHQYVMTFESSTPAGWHPLTVRVHEGKFVVRTRSGYVSGPRASGQY
jgi:Ca-activated chloride channel family protein